jgi:hypothetical protein
MPRPRPFSPPSRIASRCPLTVRLRLQHGGPSVRWPHRHGDALAARPALHVPSSSVLPPACPPLPNRRASPSVASPVRPPGSGCWPSRNDTLHRRRTPLDEGGILRRCSDSFRACTLVCLLRLLRSLALGHHAAQDASGRVGMGCLPCGIVGSALSCPRRCDTLHRPGHSQARHATAKNDHVREAPRRCPERGRRRKRCHAMTAGRGWTDDNVI